VKVDYVEGTASLVDQFDHYIAKQYLFKNRTLDYMNGWLNILEAMQEAVKVCKADLEKDLAEKSRIKEEAIVRALQDRPLNHERE
jgi:hypothetical protein